MPIERPSLHATPPHGWMNDPNGLRADKEGTWHLYYQANPQDVTWGRIHWGHLTSRDGLSWQDRGVVLSPGAVGAPDHGGCWSGCAVQTESGLFFIYTGLDTLPVESAVQRACRAVAGDEDGDWLISDVAPLLEPTATGIEGLREFRDHTVVRDGDGWLMLMAGRSPRDGGCLFAFRTQDSTLMDWRFAGVVASNRGGQLEGGCWECPDMIRGVADAVVVSLIEPVGHLVQWMVGRLGDVFEVTATGPMDVGTAFYAPQSFDTPDGRRVQFGWVRSGLDPTVGPANWTTAGWIGAMSLPRELRVEERRLVVEPAREVFAARTEELALQADGPTWRFAETGCVEFDVRAEGPISEVHLGSGGRTWVVSVQELGAEQVRIFWDHGILEIFGAGGVGTWTRHAMPRIDRLEVKGPGVVTSAAWELGAWARGDFADPHSGEDHRQQHERN